MDVTDWNVGLDQRLRARQQYEIGIARESLQLGAWQLRQDDEPIQILLTTLFGRSSAVVETAADGEVALAKLRRQRYDVILLDLMLPRLNGFEFIRAMKAVCPSYLDRTVILTAVADRTLRDFSDGRLVRRLLRKPFDIEKLVAEVVSCAESSRRIAAGVSY